MGGGGSAPAPLNQYALTKGDIQARVETAPQVFAAEQAYAPQADALSLQSMHDTLLGIPASSRNVTSTTNVAGFRNSQTGDFVAGPTAPDWKPNLRDVQRAGGISSAVSNPWQPFTQSQSSTIPVNTPATPGYLDLTRQVSAVGDELNAASQTRQRTADINDVGNLGPQALQAIMRSDPAQAHEINQLTDSTSNDLAAGYGLNPAQLRLAQQYARMGSAARGLGFGKNDNYGEALGVSQWGQNLYNQRVQNASSAIGTRASTYGNAFQQVLNRPVGAAGQPYLGSGYGISSAAMAGMPNFNTSINGADVANSNYNAANAAYISGKNNSAAMTGAAIQGGTALAGAGISAAALLSLL